jgi:para-aminobenzoate synthetase / 4-amino-4-deoxychorismate lyase
MERRYCLPAAVYTLVDRTPGTVLLEGRGSRGGQFGSRGEEPWTRLFMTPLRVCTAESPNQIPALFEEIERAVRAGLWAAGFFAYECGGYFEPKSGVGPVRDGTLAWFGIYEDCLLYDPEIDGFSGGPPADFGDLSSTSASDNSPGLAAATRIAAEFALSLSEYAARIHTIQDWIRAGDVYQLNFTAPWRVRAEGSGADLYGRLRSRQPADYGAFLHWKDDRKILCFSPELFFRIERTGGVRRIVTRPMKGTAPRGRTAGEDLERAEWLRSDPKNRSENVMIVDLVRNDLGRLARFGTVRTEELFAVERYPTLWQMTSTVTAELRTEVGFEQIFGSLFPCGSVTGAPKVRAMQLISAIEQAPRGVYTGAVGFFSQDKTVFNVAIRTLSFNGRQGTLGTGGGIVIDSDASAEYRECLLKAKFLTTQPPDFSLVETLLWDGGFPLIELHLDRLTDSARYFDYPCQADRTREALESYARGFSDRAPRKVRLLLDWHGALAISDETIGRRREEQPIGRVRIHPARTDPEDPMLFHKTTHRPLYAEAFAQASRDGLDDVLFLNQRGELTEGAIHNVFLEIRNRWLTPPVASGLLAGVYRRHLLETQAGIEECVLYEQDLRESNAVYLSNAVRGLRRVRIEPEA